MLRFPWRRLVNRATAAPRPAVRRPRLQCEELEGRIQPSAFVFSTGLPDGKVATISEVPSAHNSNTEFESADDFVLNSETVINHASFTGLLTGGATLNNVNDVLLTIYRVFPNDSDLTRTAKVPTRNNSPADNEIDNFESALGDIHFNARVLRTSFTAQNSVSGVDKIAVNSGGNGSVTGEEVQFNVTFDSKLDLPAGHYFFVPKVGLNDATPAGADFLWLSAPKPIVPPGTPFLPDLQSWMRSSPGINPDWLRVGQDVLNSTPINSSFSLSGYTVAPAINSLSQTKVAEGSPDLTITINGSNFTSNSTVLLDGATPLATTFVSASQLTATIPADFLAEEGHFKLSVVNGDGATSNATTFKVTESVPALSASAVQGQTFQQITVSGQVLDLAPEAHRVKIQWGDGHVDVVNLAPNSDGKFSLAHTFQQPPGHVRHDTIVVTAFDDKGVASDPLKLDVII
jgi:hypothetical protein